MLATHHEGYDPRRYVSLLSDDGVYDRLGMSPSFRLAYQKVEPLQPFHQILTGQVSDFLVPRARVPYPSIALSNGVHGTISAISGRIFQGRVLVSRVRATCDLPIVDSLEETISSLSSLRSAKGDSIVSRTMRAMSGILQGRPRHHNRSQDFDQYYAMQVELPCTTTTIDRIVDAHSDRLVALLVGAPDHNMLGREVIRRVTQESSELNVKAVGEHLLLNRQGIVYLRPLREYRGPHTDRFARTTDLISLSQFAKVLLSAGHSFHGADPTAARDTVRKLRQWIQRSDTTFDASVTQFWSWSALSEALQLEKHLAAWDDFFERW